MRVRAVIFDVYKTLLEVGPAPADADARWRELWDCILHRTPEIALAEFHTACTAVVSRLHQEARARGIARPEIDWPSVVREVLPPLAQLSAADLSEFIFQQVQLGHSARLSPETAGALKKLQQGPWLLGIASNAQAYTLRELSRALEPHGLSLNIFHQDLCFWSFRHGFSKPDPHVFQILSARLIPLGIKPQETLMVGDRIDNDIEPARSCGWQTWQVSLPGQPANGSITDLVFALTQA